MLTLKVVKSLNFCSGHMGINGISNRTIYRVHENVNNKYSIKILTSGLEGSIQKKTFKFSLYILIIVMVMMINAKETRQHYQEVANQCAVM